MMPERILNVFILLIARSTCMRTLAIFRDFDTAFFDSCFPCENAGILSVARLGSSKCLMLKPLSAITSSPGSTKSMNFDSFTIDASDIEPL